ncbi:MAG TPA: alanine racemase [Solirubrobacteraceae bacterium]|nr:alanine racemase [Solirubrobacteraceae bacterium]
MSRARAIARIDPAAIAANCERLLGEMAGARLCAVVKADGYGHGALAAAKAALGAGASWLAVATVEEATELREAFPDTPILIMGALGEGGADGDGEQLQWAIAMGCDVVVWREESVALAAALAAATSRTARVHVKLDTGMGRLGTRDPRQGTRVAEAAVAAPGVELVGLMTHFATADIAADEGFFQAQLAAFTQWARPLKEAHPRVLAHAANSAAVLRQPSSCLDMARCGVAIYGLDPFGEDPDAHGLRPALELSSYVAAVKLCRAGESTGYGRRFVATHDTYLGVLPIGYGDGWRRGLSDAADALVDGGRHPLVGTVSMDNVAVDLGPDPAALALEGAEAVLIGGRGGERITAEQLAKRLDTINYEITCGVSARVERTHVPAAPAPR